MSSESKDALMLALGCAVAVAAVVLDSPVLGWLAFFLILAGVS